jgi:hypothetical protein
MSACGYWERANWQRNLNREGKMRKWVKILHVPESTYHRETFPPQREADTTKAKLLEFDQSQERHILNSPKGNLGESGKSIHTHCTQPMRSRGRDLWTRRCKLSCNCFRHMCFPGTGSWKTDIKVLVSLHSRCLWVHSLSLDRRVCFTQFIKGESWVVVSGAGEAGRGRDGRGWLMGVKLQLDNEK